MPLADRPLKSNAGAAASSDAYFSYNTICDRTAVDKLPSAAKRRVRALDKKSR
jgi:hypothetical protein